MLRIKIDQQAALEAMQKAQRENAGDTDNDEDMDMTESKAEISTFQDDLETICDFMVSDTTLFTTKLLQGVKIKALYRLDEHRKPTQAQELEALDLLNEI